MDTRRLPYVGDHGGVGSATAGVSIFDKSRLRPRYFPGLIVGDNRISLSTPRRRPDTAKPVPGMRYGISFDARMRMVRGIDEGHK
jgi:hypothetical protein